MRLTRQTIHVLNALLERPSEPQYGLELARSIGYKTGTVYPILARLEDQGWVEASWEQIDPSEASRPRRRYYQLTNLGLTAGRAAVVDAYKEAIPSWFTGGAIT